MSADVDLLATMARFEEELSGDPAPHRRHLLISILVRWQTDPDLGAESRARAAALVARFGRQSAV